MIKVLGGMKEKKMRIGGKWRGIVERNEVERSLHFVWMKIFTSCLRTYSVIEV